jgi:hypothetical protein
MAGVGVGEVDMRHWAWPHEQGTCHPLGRFPKQVVGDHVGDVGRVSRPTLGQIWSWAKNEVCSTNDALQFCLRVHDGQNKVKLVPPFCILFSTMYSPTFILGLNQVA